MFWFNLSFFSLKHTILSGQPPQRTLKAGRPNIYQVLFSISVHLYSTGNIPTIFQKYTSCRVLMKISTDLKFTYS